MHNLILVPFFLPLITTIQLFPEPWTRDLLAVCFLLDKSMERMNEDGGEEQGSIFRRLVNEAQVRATTPGGQPPWNRQILSTRR